MITMITSRHTLQHCCIECIELRWDEQLIGDHWRSDIRDFDNRVEWSGFSCGWGDAYLEFEFGFDIW